MYVINIPNSLIPSAVIRSLRTFLAITTTPWMTIYKKKYGNTYEIALAISYGVTIYSLKSIVDIFCRLCRHFILKSIVDIFCRLCRHFILKSIVDIFCRLCRHFILKSIVDIFCRLCRHFILKSIVDIFCRLCRHFILKSIVDIFCRHFMQKIIP